MRAPADAEALDGPLAPPPHVGRGRDIAAVAAAADQDPIIAGAAAVHGEEMEFVGISPQAGADREGRRQGRGGALRQVAPTLRRGQRGDALDAAWPADGRAVVAHRHIAGRGRVGGVGLGRGHLEVGLVVAGMAEAVDHIADLNTGGMRAGIVDGDALAAGPLQGIPDALGVVGPTVKAVNWPVRTQLGLPGGDAMRSGMGAGGKSGPVGGRPDGERWESLIDAAFCEETAEIRQAALGRKELHHRRDEAVHAVSVNLLCHCQRSAPCLLDGRGAFACRNSCHSALQGLRK